MSTPQNRSTESDLDVIRKRTLAAPASTGGPSAGAPIAVTDATFESVVAKPGLVLIDFWAPWCGPCRYLAPILDEIAQDLAGKVTIGKVNVDENPVAPEAFRVTGIPTLYLFKDGKAVSRVVGGASKDQLLGWILQHTA